MAPDDHTHRADTVALQLTVLRDLQKIYVEHIQSRHAWRLFLCFALDDLLDNYGADQRHDLVLATYSIKEHVILSIHHPGADASNQLEHWLRHVGAIRCPSNVAAGVSLLMRGAWVDKMLHDLANGRDPF